ncbi:MAG: DUF47 family protein [Candidatus Heimdallarchaeota archaeon]|nr:DUF47 family protein [Candidatus Heimdallarchaeota archaeon]MCK5048790.1 DUF47 family protein [Candidatus Heimdallarchaeota archaeon]
MKRISDYFLKRKQAHAHTKAIAHLKLVKTVSEKMQQGIAAWINRDLPGLKRSAEIMIKEERSADLLEQEIIKELSASELPSKVREINLQFVRTNDKAAGLAKRGVKNIVFLYEFKLPSKVNKMLIDLGKYTTQAIETLIEASEIIGIASTDEVLELTKKVSDLEGEVDEIYSQIKQSYFEVEKSFNSAAGLILFDHALRNFETITDMIEDSSDLLSTLLVTKI